MLFQETHPLPFFLERAASAGRKSTGSEPGCETSPAAARGQQYYIRKTNVEQKMITFVLPGVQTSPLLCSARYKNSLKKPREHGQAPSAFVS